MSDNDGEPLGILLPPSVAVALPHTRLPDGLTQGRNVLLPEPELPPEFDLATGSRIAVPKSKPSEEVKVVVPRPDEVVPFLRSEVSTASREASIHYLAAPWEYFGKKLSENLLESPTREIKAKIQSHREKTKRILDTLSETDRVLLNSRIDYVREMALEKLREAGVTDADIADLYRSQDQIVDVADLDFSIHKELEDKDEVAKHYKDFVLGVFEDLVDKSIGRSELSGICSYLTTITEALQYRHQLYRISNAELVDVLTEKLTEFSADALQSTVLWDFISHLELTDNVYATLYDLMIKGNAQKHPLFDHLAAKLDKGENPPFPENIGMELEGIPKMYLGGIDPKGFRMGLDGGGTMPELRKANEDIDLGPSFYDDLYELWYWARMSRFHGVSLHIHIDSSDGLMARCQKIFGTDYNDVRLSYGKKNSTVELRFNLANYYVGDESAKTRSFNPDHYVLKDFIKELLRVKHATDVTTDPEHVYADGEALGRDLHPLWQRFKPKEQMNSHIVFQPPTGNADGENQPYNEFDYSVDVEDRDPIKLEELMSKAEESNWNPQVILEGMSYLYYGEMTLEAMQKLAEATDWDFQVIHEALRNLPFESMTVSMLMTVVENTQRSYALLEQCFNLLPNGAMTLEAFTTLGEQTEWEDLLIMEKCVNNLSYGEMSLDVLMKLVHASWWSYGNLAIAIDKLPADSMTMEALYIIGEESDWDMTMIDFAISRLPEGVWTLGELMALGEKSNWKISALLSGLLGISDGSMNLETLTTVAEKVEWSNAWVANALKKFPKGGMTLEGLSLIVEHPSLNRVIASIAIDRLPEGVWTLEEYIALMNRSGWSIEMLQAGINNLPDSALTLEFLNSLGEQSEWSYLVVNFYIQRLPEGVMTVEEMAFLEEKVGFNEEMIEHCVNRLPKSAITLEVLIDLGERLNWQPGLVESFIERFPEENVTLDMLTTIGEKTRWYIPVMSQAIRKFPFKVITLEIVDTIIEHVPDKGLVLSALIRLPHDSMTFDALKNIGRVFA